MTEQTVAIERRGAVAWIRLQRPDALNAWNQDLADNLLEAVTEVGEDHEARTVVITGAGRAFSSGADLREPRKQKPDGRPDIEGRIRTRGTPIVREIRRMPKPVIAAVNGPAAGIGCSLALSCDLVLAARSAFFMFAFVRVGLMPDGGGMQLAQARVGMTRAMEMAMTGGKVGAERAAEIGLINECLDDEALLGRADELATGLAKGPMLSYGAIKQSFNEIAFPELASQLEREATVQQSLADSADYKEGVAAFRDGREPEFRSGR